jgi:predicted transcriptional regulator
MKLRTQRRSIYILKSKEMKKEKKEKKLKPVSIRQEFVKQIKEKIENL